MTKNRVWVLSLLSLLVLPAALVASTSGRLSGVVEDQQGNPIEGARVTLMAQEVQSAVTTETNRKGKFNLIVADATKAYLIRIEKEGYQPVQEPIEVPIGSMIRRTWQLVPGESAAGADMLQSAEDPAGKLYNEGARLYNTGDFDGALEKFEAASQLDASIPEIWSGLARIYWSREQDAEGIAAAEKLVELDAENVLGLRILADAYREHGDARAEQMLDRLVAVDKTEGTAKRVFNQGVEKVKQGDSEAAIQRFEQAISIDPTLAPAYRVLGQLYNSQSDHEQAVVYGQKLLELEPGSAEAHSILYAAYQILGNQEGAQASLKALQSAQPEELAEALFSEGKSYFDNNQPTEAIRVLSQLLSVQPDHPGANYILGLSYLNVDEQAKAVEQLERFIELAPDHPEAPAAREMLGYLK